MNAGRLRAVLESIKRDYESNKALMKLEAASQALSASVRTPNDATATAFQDAWEDQGSVLKIAIVGRERERFHLWRASEVGMFIKLKD